MSKEKTVDLGLKTAFDELFMSDAGRAENRLPKIYDIPLSEIDDFPDHPFQVRLDDDMDALVQSVKERGTGNGTTKGGARRILMRLRSLSQIPRKRRSRPRLPVRSCRRNRKTKRRRPMPSTPSCMRSTMILSAGSP